MANWCFTLYAFYVDDKKHLDQLVDLSNKIQEYTLKSCIKNDFGDFWLGNIVNGFGFDYKEVECRGSLDGEPTMGNEAFLLNVETAWSPNLEMWDLILKKFYPNVKYVYQAEEPGCQLYINTDTKGKFFTDKFILYLYEDDTSSDFIDVLYFQGEKDLAAWVNKTQKSKVTNENEVLEYCKNSKYMELYKFQNV